MPGCRVSIIITYFDYARFIEETVESILAQTFIDYEVILVEDGGEVVDKSLLEKWRKNIPIEVIRLDKSQGLPVARNTGFERSSGELLVFLDSDDGLEPGFLAETVEALEKNQSDGVYTQVQTFGDWDYLWKPEVTLIGLLCGTPGPATFLMKRNVFEVVKGFAPHLPFNCDHSFWIDAISKGFSFTRIDKPLFRYRKHPQSMSTIRKNEWWKGIERLSHEHRELYIQHLPEILSAKEKQFRELESEYQNVYAWWKEAKADYNKVNDRYNELTQSSSFRLYQKILDLKASLSGIFGREQNGHKHASSIKTSQG